MNLPEDTASKLACTKNIAQLLSVGHARSSTHLRDRQESHLTRKLKSLLLTLSLQDCYGVGSRERVSSSRGVSQLEASVLVVFEIIGRLAGNLEVISSVAVDSLVHILSVSLEIGGAFASLLEEHIKVGIVTHQLRDHALGRGVWSRIGEDPCEFSLVGGNHINILEQILAQRFVFASHVKDDLDSALLSKLSGKGVDLLRNFSLKHQDVSSSDGLFPLLTNLFLSLISLVGPSHNDDRVVSCLRQRKDVSLSSARVLLGEHSRVVHPVLFHVLNESGSLSVIANLTQHLHSVAVLSLFGLGLQSRSCDGLVGSFSSESLENLVFSGKGLSHLWHSVHFEENVEVERSKDNDLLLVGLLLWWFGRLFFLFRF